MSEISKVDINKKIIVDTVAEDASALVSSGGRLVRYPIKKISGNRIFSYALGYGKDVEVGSYKMDFPPDELINEGIDYGDIIVDTDGGCIFQYVPQIGGDGDDEASLPAEGLHCVANPNGEKGDKGEAPEGVMIYKGNMGYNEPYKPNKGDVYYCNNTITSSKQYSNLKFGSCDYIGDNHVAISMDSNTNAFFTDAIGSDCNIYRTDERGNIIASLSPTVTNVEDGGHIYFSGTTQAELETIFSYGSASGYGILHEIITEPLIQGNVVLYTGEKWIALNNTNEG